MSKSRESDIGTDVPAAAAFMLTANPTLAKVWLDLIAESGRFMTKRLEADLELQRAVLACKTPTELMELQSKFMRNTAAQYSEEVSKLFAIAFSTSEGIAGDTQSSRKTEHNDVPV